MPKYVGDEKEVLQAVFLEAYEETASLGEASRRVGITTTTHRRWLAKDASYAERFRQCRVRMEAAGVRYKYEGRPRNLERRTDEQARFLAAFAECGQVNPAAIQAGVVFRKHYDWLKDDPAYAERFAVLDATAGEEGRERAKAAAREGRSRLKGRRITSGRRYERVQAKKVEFLEALAVLGVIADAAEYIGVSRQVPINWAQHDPRFKSQMTEIRKATRDIAVERQAERLSKAGKAAWTDKEKRTEWARRQREEFWTPERRATESEKQRVRTADPAVRAAMSEAQIRSHADPQVQMRHSEGMKRAWADPEKRESWLASLRSEERRTAASKKTKDQWADKTPEERREATRPMRRALKGGHRITSLEALVIAHIGRLRVGTIPHFVFDEVDAVADVFVPHLNLDVECDGSHFHDESTAEREATRDAALAAIGVTVLRLSETEITAGDFSRLAEALKEGVC